MAFAKFLVFLVAMAFASEDTLLAKRSASITYDVYDSPPSWYASGSPFLVLDGDVEFYFQGDGNIVVYHGPPSATGVLWNSQSGQHPCGNPGDCQLVFQTDGNLVAYVGQQYFWATSTNAYMPNHMVSAAILMFRNTSPYISLYDQNGKRMFYTTGTNGFVSQEPGQDGGGSGVIGGGGAYDPCGSYPGCVYCFDDCSTGCISACQSVP